MQNNKQQMILPSCSHILIFFLVSLKMDLKLCLVVLEESVSVSALEKKIVPHGPSLSSNIHVNRIIVVCRYACFSVWLIERQDVVHQVWTYVDFDIFWSQVVSTRNRNTHECTHAAARSCFTPTHLRKQPNTPTLLQATDTAGLVIRVTEGTFTPCRTDASSQHWFQVIASSEARRHDEWNA